MTTITTTTTTTRYSPLEQVNFHFERFFPKFFHDQRWTIAEPVLARDGHHGIAMVIVGPPGNAITISELFWNLNTGNNENFKSPSHAEENSPPFPPHLIEYAK